MYYHQILIVLEQLRFLRCHYLCYLLQSKREEAYRCLACRVCIAPTCVSPLLTALYWQRHIFASYWANQTDQSSTLYLVEGESGGGTQFFLTVINAIIEYSQAKLTYTYTWIPHRLSTRTYQLIFGVSIFFFFPRFLHRRVLDMKNNGYTRMSLLHALDLW